MIDVSEYQSEPDWSAVYEHGGIRHAFIRLMEKHTINGLVTGHTDRQYARNVKEARAAGVNIGLYMYADPNEAPHASARDFLRAAGKQLRPGDLPPALDLEVTQHHSWEYLNDWKAQWFAIVDAHIGVRATFYSYWYFWKQMHLFEDRPVWGAAVQSPGQHFEPPKSWAFHQYSFTGSVIGIHGHVDLSRILHDVPAIK